MQRLFPGPGTPRLTVPAQRVKECLLTVSPETGTVALWFLEADTGAESRGNLAYFWQRGESQGQEPGLPDSQHAPSQADQVLGAGPGARPSALNLVLEAHPIPPGPAEITEQPTVEKPIGGHSRPLASWCPAPQHPPH